MELSLSPWYAVHTRPHKEVLVAGLLEERLHATIFLPEVLQKARAGKALRAGMAMRPLFPTYLFAQMDLNEHPPSAVRRLPGVLRLLGSGNTPLAVPSPVIEALGQECRRLNAAGGLFATDLCPGERVRLTSGPLSGLEAVFVEPLAPGDRAAVLLQFLNRETQVTVGLADLERVREVQRPPRQRSSRGRGRPIRSKVPGASRAA